MNGEPALRPKKPISPWVWVGCGCTLALVAVLAFAGTIAYVVFTAMHSSTPYKDAMARAGSDARVQESLGTPLEAGWFVSGTINKQNQGGNCDLSIPLIGPKQEGELRVTGTRNDGRWSYTSMTVTPDTGPPIDLLE
jgi:hypothetical protein